MPCRSQHSLALVSHLFQSTLPFAYSSPVTLALLLFLRHTKHKGFALAFVSVPRYSPLFWSLLQCFLLKEAFLPNMSKQHPSALSSSFVLLHSASFCLFFTQVFSLSLSECKLRSGRARTLFCALLYFQNVQWCLEHKEVKYFFE